MMVRFYFFFLSFAFFFFALADSENYLGNDIRGTQEVQTAQYEPDLNQKYQRDWSSFENENQIPKIEALAEGNGEKRKWASVLTFDRLKNLTEKDKGPGNDTKVIFINSEDHLTIYENNNDEDETDIQDHDEHFSLLSPENFLSRIHSSEEKSLERSKRQAEGGKKRCKCRRKGRRGVRRRKRRRRGRRRRVGQARQGRRRRRGRRRGAGRKRRGRRRCVCRKKGAGGGGEGEGEEGGEGGEEGEGKGDEEPEVEEADGEGETTTTEGGGGEEEEADNEGEGKEGDEGDGEGEEEGEAMGDGEEGEGEEGDKSKEEEENEDSEDDENMGSSDESDEKGTSGEGLKKKEIPMSSTNHEVPVYVMYPGTSGAHGAVPNAVGTPTYQTLPVPFSPYPYYTVSQSTLHGTDHHLSKM